MTKIQTENISPSRYRGWIRTNTDSPPAQPTGKTVAGRDYVQGRKTGRNTWALDIREDIAPNWRSDHLIEGPHIPSDWQLQPLPGNPIQWFGGVVKVGGNEMEWVSMQPDAAGYTIHLRKRIGRLALVELFTTWYPDQPGWAPGEVLITASNPGIADLEQTIEGLRLDFGNALTIVPGMVTGTNSIVPAGTRFADGQARAFPVLFVWLQHIKTMQDWASISAFASLGVTAKAIDKLLWQGNPRLPASFNPHSFGALLPEAIRRLHTFEAGVIGPNSTSGDAGQQYDTVFPCGEGVPMVIYLSALKMANRPCHHLEINGDQHYSAPFESGKLPIMHDGRPHSGLWGLVDRRGKPHPIAAVDATNWWGPDVEHSFWNTGFAGLRIFGSKAMQQLASMQARLYPKQWTVTPGWSTSQVFATRAFAWECQRVVQLCENLEDQSLAANVLAHFYKRWNLIAKPAWWNKPQDILDIRVDDPRLGLGPWWLPWQQACAAYFLDLAGEYAGIPEARQLARRAATRVLDSCWRQAPNGRWESAPASPVVAAGLDEAVVEHDFTLARAFVHEQTGMPVDPGDSFAAPAVQFDEIFNYYGMSLAVAVKLKEDPNDAKARAIWNQLISEATQIKQTCWLAPDVV